MKAGYLFVLAHNLRIRRKSLAETQLAFANASGVSYRLYQRLEAGVANPTLSSLANIARRLNVEIVELLNLKMIRTEELSQQSIEGLFKKFENVPYAVGLRSHEGDVIWANLASIKLHHLEGKSFPIKIQDIVTPETAEGYKRQLVSEKLGIAHPYTNQLKSSNGEAIFVRYHPILIYVGQSKYPKYVIAYSSEIHSYSEEHYYDFSQAVIECLNSMDCV